MDERPTSVTPENDHMKIWNMEELGKAIVRAAEGQEVQMPTATPRLLPTSFYPGMYESNSMLSYPSSSSVSSSSCSLQSSSTSTPVTMFNHSWLYPPLYTTLQVEPSYVDNRRQRNLRKMKANYEKMMAKRKIKKTKDKVRQKYRIVIRLDDDDVSTTPQEPEKPGAVETMDLAGDEAKK